MSRVYDALQQCLPSDIDQSTLGELGPSPVFSHQFTDQGWEINSAAQLKSNVSSEDRLPTMFSTFSFASEQFRLLATRLQQLAETRPLKSFLLTSSVAEEGKSLVSLNLALSMAQGGLQKVLLVDADLRNPSLCRNLRTEDLQGIKEWYLSSHPVSAFVRRVDESNVWILPAGREAVDPVELINSPRMSQLLSTAASVFDWIVVDSSPLLPLADAGLLSRITDGTILVIRRDKTSKRALSEAVERVASSKMVGFLLNDFPSAHHYGYERNGAEVACPAANVGRVKDRK